MRHAEIGDDDIEALSALHGGSEGLYPCTASMARGDDMPILLQGVLQRFDQQWVIIDQEDAQAPLHDRRVLDPRRYHRGGESRKIQADRRTLSRCAFDLEFGAVALDHAVDHGQSKPAPAFAFRRVKRLEAAPPRVFVHAYAGVGHFDEGTRLAVRAYGLARSHGQRAAGRHRIHGVENEIGQRIADFMFGAHDLRHRIRQICLQIHHRAASLR